ncbi:hypothetical protein KI387_028529, partial [Taxus chinensis]
MTLGSFGTCGTRKREARGSGDSGEAGKRRTNAFWDMRDKTRLGRIGRKCDNGSGQTWDIWDVKAR